jgi:hypothetical protein
MVGPALFVATFTVEGLLRPGYDARSMYVSELSLGPRGWIQIVNFVVFGALLCVFARTASSDLRIPRALLTVIAVCIAGSGPLVMDAVGTEHATAHGMVHQLLGAIVFSLMPVTCFVYAWRVRSWWTLAAGVVIFLAVVVLKVAQLGSMSSYRGLFQRIALVTFLAWVFALAVQRRVGRA